MPPQGGARSIDTARAQATVSTECGLRPRGVDRSHGPADGRAGIGCSSKKVVSLRVSVPPFLKLVPFPRPLRQRPVTFPKLYSVTRIGVKHTISMRRAKRQSRAARCQRFGLVQHAWMTRARGSTSISIIKTVNTIQLIEKKDRTMATANVTIEIGVDHRPSVA